MRRIDIPGKGLIHFEGLILPEGAKYYESASFFDSLSEETKKWVLDLRYAWGRKREAASPLVVRACDELEGRIYSDRAQLFAGLRETFKEADPAEICREWLSAIQTMRGCAESREVCHWTLPPEEGEVAYFLNQIILLVRSMEKKQDRSVLSKELEDDIRDQNNLESNKIRFICDMTDSLSG